MDAANQAAAKAVNPAASQTEESKATARMQAVAGRKEVDAQAEVTVNIVARIYYANLLQGGEFKRLALAVSDLIYRKRDFLGHRSEK